MSAAERAATAANLDSWEEEFRESVRDVLRSGIAPCADDWERDGCIPRAAWRDLGDSGLLSLSHNGPGFIRSAIFLEELGKLGYAGIRASIGVHAYMASAYIELFGTEEQRDRVLVPARAGAKILALALSEAEGGSDLRNLRTVAVPTGDRGYRISGEKCYVVNGTQADFIVMLARTSASRPEALGGCSLFLIDAQSDGIRRTPQPMLGWRSGDIAGIQLNDVEVPRESLLGAEGKAVGPVMKVMDFERLVAGLLAVGGARHCMDELGAAIADRQLRGTPLSRERRVQHHVADLESEYEMVAHYAYHAPRGGRAAEASIAWRRWY